jgi:FHA domain
MARLKVQTTGVTATHDELLWGITRVGRAEENDIVISHPSVSGRHCEIELGHDFVVVRDLQSTNGTFIDGRPIQVARLEPGQRLKLGQVEALVERAQEQVVVPQLQTEEQPHTNALADGTLSCVHHADMRAYWRCTQCQLLYCTGCIHELHMVKGRSHRLCPKCSRDVELIVWDAEAGSPKSLWGRIKGALKAKKEKTVRIR